VLDLHASVVDHTAYVLMYLGDAVARRDPEVDHCPSVARENVVLGPGLKHGHRSRRSHHRVRRGTLFELSQHQRSREPQIREHGALEDREFGADAIEELPAVPHKCARRSRSAFAITDTELSVIAALAQIGEISVPRLGYNTPAATGTPIAL
jgi:hypothetical protein